MTLIDKAEALAMLRKHANGETVLGGQVYQSLTLETALEALAALPARGVGVKPLVWVDFPDRGAKAQAWNEANYMIQRWSDGRWELSASYPGYGDSIYGIDRFYSTLEAAKAAAQADYEARILAAPTDAAQAREAALLADIARGPMEGELMEPWINSMMKRAAELIGGSK